MISENTANSNQPANDVSDRYQESESMIAELRAHADVCGGSLPLGGCGLTVADILRRKAARRAAIQKPVKFFSIEYADKSADGDVPEISEKAN